MRYTLQYLTRTIQFSVFNISTLLQDQTHMLKQTVMHKQSVFKNVFIIPTRSATRHDLSSYDIHRDQSYQHRAYTVKNRLWFRALP